MDLSQGSWKQNDYPVETFVHKQRVLSAAKEENTSNNVYVRP